MDKELMKKNLGEAMAAILTLGNMFQETEKWEAVGKDIDYCERSFGRNLTQEEKELVLNSGKNALFDKLGLDEEDFNTMLRAFALISAGFTESAERYDYELEQNNYKVLDLFKSLINDLECVEAEKHKIRVGKKEDIRTKIKVQGENAGYREDKDPELDQIFKDADAFVGPTPSDHESTKRETDFYDLSKVFASETKCGDMQITGDTYEEDDKSWAEKYPEEKECAKLETSPDTCKTKVDIDKAIERLDKGCELELDDETIDAIVEKLWKERNNLSIKIHNNKISLR